MNKFKAISVALSAALLLGGLCARSLAMGYGQPATRAVLGERLSSSIPVHLDGGDDVSNECLAADVYFGDDKLPSAAVQVALQPGWGEDRVIRLMTDKVVNEPVVTIYLVAGCRAKVTRKFVAFADPPEMAGSVNAAPALSSSAVPAAPAPYSGAPAKVSVGGLPIETGSLPGPSVQMARTPRAKSAPKPVAGPALRADGRESVHDPVAATPSERAAPSRRAGERLILDAADLDALILPELRMSTALHAGPPGDEASPQVAAQRAAAAALWRAINASPEQMERDRVRLQELEQRLASLQQASASAPVAGGGASAATPHSVWESARLSTALAALVALLSAALVVLGLKLRRGGQDAHWLAAAARDEPLADPAVNADAAPLDAPQDVPFGSPSGAPQAADTGHRVADPDARPAPLSAGAAPTEPAPLPPTPVFSVSLPEAGAVRDVTMEELIDLEQQAEFFVVLGQDDAAVDLLEGHIHHASAVSPLPFLKLLEIYQRLGRRADYERTQSQFDQHFNGHAPAWEADLQQGRPLADYPDLIERLQRLWPAPAQAMELLERLLTRPTGEVETLDLPAYRELLFLYAVARDRHEHESDARFVVDLNAPLAGAHQARLHEPEPRIEFRPSAFQDGPTQDER